MYPRVPKQRRASFLDRGPCPEQRSRSHPRAHARPPFGGRIGPHIGNPSVNAPGCPRYRMELPTLSSSCWTTSASGRRPPSADRCRRPACKDWLPRVCATIGSTPRPSAARPEQRLSPLGIITTTAPGSLPNRRQASRPTTACCHSWSNPEGQWQQHVVVRQEPQHARLGIGVCLRAIAGWVDAQSSSAPL